MAGTDVNVGSESDCNGGTGSSQAPPSNGDAHPPDEKVKIVDEPQCRLHPEPVSSDSHHAEKGAEPPNGGWGWMVVLGCFMMHIILGGLYRSYGMIYIQLRKVFNSNAAVTAWVGGAGIAIHMGLSPMASFFASKFSTRSVMMVGGVIFGSGIALCALAPCTEYMFFSYSLLAGLGGTLIYAPAIVLVGQYFTTKRGIATGISTAGSGFGMFAFPPLMEWLFEYYGFAGTMILLGGVMYNTIVCGALMRPLAKPAMKPKSPIYNPKLEKRDDTEEVIFLSSDPESDGDLKKLSNGEIKCTCKEIAKADSTPTEKKGWQKHLDLTLWKDPRFMTFALSLGFQTVTYISAQMLVPDLARSVGHSDRAAASLMSIVGVSDMCGRMSFGFIYDRPRIRPHRAKFYNLAMVGTALTCIMLAFTTSYWGLAAICALHGIINGGVVSQRAVIVSDFVGVEKLGSSFSLTVFTQGVGLSVGPSLAGLLRDYTGNYTASYMFCFTTGTLATLTFLAGTIYTARKNKKQEISAVREIKV